MVTKINGFVTMSIPKSRLQKVGGYKKWVVTKTLIQNIYMLPCYRRGMRHTKPDKIVISTFKRRYDSGCYECGKPFTAPEWTYWRISRPNACEINTTGKVFWYQDVYTPVDEDWHVCYCCSEGHGWFGTTDFPKKTFRGVEIDCGGIGCGADNFVDL